MQEDFARHIQNHFPELLKNRFLVAISGGLDSIVLTHLLLKTNVAIELAHCNFKLRNEESETDQRFVEEFAERRQLRLHITSFQTKDIAQANGVSTQIAARDLRYDWFYKLVKSQDLAGVLTAHHQDDQIETFFINLNRGSGIAGLTGIPENSNGILRPLLPFSRAQIEAYALENKIEWREDSSNESNDYQRNALRNVVLPELHKVLPQLQGNFNKTVDYLNDVKCIVDDAVVRFRESVITTNNTGIDIHLDELWAYPHFEKLLFYLLQPYGFTRIDEVIQLSYAATGKYLSNPGYILLKDRDLLRLEKSAEPITKKWYILPETTLVETAHGHLTFESLTTDSPVQLVRSQLADNVLWLDKERLDYPLTLRVWSQGDRLEPFGMKGSQLVSDILTDRKLSRIEKQQTLTLWSTEKLLWIPSIRASRHFEVKETTKEILKISWNT